MPVHIYCKRHNVSIETGARDLRRRLLGHYASLFSVKTVLMAHHQDDHCESILFQLSRGSKLGLKGILDQSRLSNQCNIVRPLLNIDKQTILDYLHKHNISYCNDSTNTDTQFTRNHIRSKIMPELSKVNPKFKSHFAEFVSYFQLQHAYLKTLLVPLYDQLIIEKESIKVPISLFKDTNEFLIQLLFYDLLVTTLSLSNIQQLHIHSLSSFSTDSETGASLDLPQGYTAFLDYEFLIISKKESKLPSFCYYFKNWDQWEAVEELKSEFKLTLLDKLPNSFKSTSSYAFFSGTNITSISELSIRSFQADYRFVPYGHTSSYSLNRYLSSLKAPHFIRNKIPLFFVQDDLVWVVGYELSDSFKLTNSSHKIIKMDVRATQ